MKSQTKTIKNKRLERDICDKYQEAPMFQVEFQFPKGGKNRGKALCVFAESFWSGYRAGIEFEKRRIK